MGEADVLFWIRDGLTCPALDTASVAADAVFRAAVMIIATAVLLIPKKTRPYAAVLMLALLMSACSVEVLKAIVQRPRPFETYGVDIITDAVSGYSFPSGHSCCIFTFATVICMLFGRRAVPLFALSAFVAFTRLYLFVHYPSDVAAGAVMGMFFGWAAVRLAGMCRRNRQSETLDPASPRNTCMDP